VEPGLAQSKVSVQLATDEQNLRIFVDDAGEALTSIAERSDGLKAFVALSAFLALRDTTAPPILLIDEAEQHLHYDAQADLIRILTRQTAASQVIYTTHSAGCLPQDLGAAVRVIVPADVGERSEIRNGFWDDTPGFDSLLMAMGATTFAFSAARHAVLAEGAVETILLPRLFREATGREDPGFQVAPGLANVPKADFRRLDLVAARVAFVVDNDDNGRKIARSLERSGVPSDHIVPIAISGIGDSTIEDLLDVSAYAAAVNEELRRSHGDAVRITEDSLRTANRPHAVAEACAALDVPPPNKTAVARRLVEFESDRTLLSADGTTALNDVYRRLLTALGLE